MVIIMRQLFVSHQCESQSCYGYCQESRSCSAGYNLRRHSARVAECKKENNTDISSNYLKWKESIRAKRLYQDNVLRRQKVKDIRVEKYKMNLLYRVKVKRLSVEKYKIYLLHGEKVKRLMIEKYHNNVLYREKLNWMSSEKY